MIILKCVMCKGEVDIVSADRSTNKKIKCRRCGFTNVTETKEPEIIVIRKRPQTTVETEMNSEKTICVIGVWHLGAVNAAGFAEKGFNVIGIDFDSAKVEKLQKGIPPLFEPGLEELFKKHLDSGKLVFSNNIELVRKADLVVIAYDSPINEKDEVDIGPIILAAWKAALFIKPTTPLVITSQVPLGSCEKIDKEMHETSPKWMAGVIYSPENLRLGTAISRFLKPDMLVFGANNGIHEMVLPFYESFETTKITMDLRSAEMVKHALNTFLATSITFANEIANLSDRLGADAVAVGKALKYDSRIGKSALVMPGLGFSGGTLARDVTQLRKFAKQHKYKAKLLDSIVSINEGTFDEIVLKLKNKLITLNDKSIVILGLTYKPGTSTARRSPAIKLAEKLNKAGAKCFGYDEMASNEEMRKYDNLIIRGDNLYDLVKDKDAVVVVTEWEKFQNLDYEYMALIMKTPILIDCKNFLQPDIIIRAGFDYQGFGRRG